MRADLQVDWAELYGSLPVSMRRVGGELVVGWVHCGVGDGDMPVGGIGRWSGGWSGKGSGTVCTPWL
jgi:hypothetical protein